MSSQTQVDALIDQQGGDPREDELLLTSVADYGMPTSTELEILALLAAGNSTRRSRSSSASRRAP
jgi:hypothetical protein